MTGLSVKTRTLSIYILILLESVELVLMEKVAFVEVNVDGNTQVIDCPDGSMDDVSMFAAVV